MIALLLTLLAAPDTLELSLGQALDVALKHSPAQTQVSASRSQGTLKLIRGIGALVPTPSASVSYGNSKERSQLLPDSTIATSGWTGTAALNQVVFDPQVFAGVANAIIYAGYYADDARDKLARLIYDVTSDYLGLLTARLLRDAAASALDRADDNLRLTSEKLRLGAASQIDVMRSDVFRSQAQIQLLTSDKTLGVANATFLATAGITGDVAVKPTEQLTAPADFEVTNADSLVSEIERRNPGFKLAVKSSTISKLNLVASAASILPSASVYWSSDYADTLFPSSLKHWDNNDNISYGLRLSFPLLDIKSYILGIADASVQSRLARAGAAAARLQVRSTATSAVLGYEEARQRYDYAKRNLELNQELYRLAQEQQRLGAISLIDFFSVETNLAQAQATYVQALSDTYVQAAQISYLLGRTQPVAPAR